MRHILFIIACLVAAGANAQDYPARTVKLVVPIGPGGGTDILAPHMAQKLAQRLRQPFVVENRPGAGSIVGTEYVARSPADGYTLLVGGIFNMVMNKALVKNLSYEPARDFVPLGYISAYPFVLVARQDLPAERLADFVRYAAARPGKLTYGSAGLGSLQHVWGTVLLKMLGLDMVHVPFKSAPTVHQEMLAGRIGAFAVSSSARTPHLAAVPTLKESGIEFAGESWFAMFAPAATPAAVVSGLRTEEVLREADFAALIEKDGGRVLAIAVSEQAGFLREEVDRWSALVARYGVATE